MVCLRQALLLMASPCKAFCSQFHFPVQVSDWCIFDGSRREGHYFFKALFSLCSLVWPPVARDFKTYPLGPRSFQYRRRGPRLRWLDWEQYKKIGNCVRERYVAFIGLIKLHVGRARISLSPLWHLLESSCCKGISSSLPKVFIALNFNKVIFNRLVKVYIEYTR